MVLPHLQFDVDLPILALIVDALYRETMCVLGGRGATKIVHTYKE